MIAHQVASARCPLTDAGPRCETQWDKNRSTAHALHLCVHEAQRHRFQSDVHPRYGTHGQGATKQVVIHEASGERKILSGDSLALGMELMLSPVSMQNFAPGGEGSYWFGVHTLQNPVDAATIATVLWEVRPSLVIEIGTECGGSGVFLGQMLRMIGDGGKVLTYDALPVSKRQCSGARGFDSAVWARLVHDGILESRVADITAPRERAYVRSMAAAAARVLIIDDGDHFATPLIVHFVLFADLVSPGSYYLIQDTRLDRTCRQQLAALKARNLSRSAWEYCRKIVGDEGGPARAVRYLGCVSPRFRTHFRVDRSKEPWVFTQHPAGWLRRLGVGTSPAPRPAVRQFVQPRSKPTTSSSRTTSGLMAPPDWQRMAGHNAKIQSSESD